MQENGVKISQIENNKILVEVNNSERIITIDEKSDKQNKDLFCKITKNKMKQLFNDNIDKNTLKRYEKEKNYIIKNNYYNYFMLLRECKRKYNLIFPRGIIASSFIVYLLGVSYINPIEYNIPFEMLTENKEKIKLYCELDLENNTELNLENINSRYESINKMFNEIMKYHINFNNNDINILIEKIKPKNIDELIKIYGMYYGTGVWDKNNEYLIKEHNINELISTKEDIYLYLISKNIDKDKAIEIMKFIGNGKVKFNKEKWIQYINLMKEYNIPNWYIESYEKIKYLYPKAHIVCRLVLNINKLVQDNKINFV